MKFTDLLKDKFTLIMSLPANDPELARSAVEGGADVLKVHINIEHRASKTLFKSLKEEKSSLQEILHATSGRPCGIVPGGSADLPFEELYEINKLGFDFISLYAHHANADILDLGGISRMIAVDQSYDTGMVKVLDSLGADVLEASIVPPGEYGLRLTLSDLIRYRVLRESTSLPIIIPSQKHIEPHQAAKLKMAGANGIMVGAVVTGRSSRSIYDTVSAFRESIDNMMR